MEDLLAASTSKDCDCCSSLMPLSCGPGRSDSFFAHDLIDRDTVS